MDLLGQIILDIREDVRDVKRRLSHIEDVRLASIERKLDAHNDDITVLSAMVMRHV